MDFCRKLFLAPLAGITDRAFRKVCRQFGADVVCTEMISAKGIWYQDKKTESLMMFGTDEMPCGIQLFGSEPEIMAHAVQVAAAHNPAYIDLNMGCPVPKIVKNGDGSALMKSLSLASKIIEAAVKSVSLPVTVKFRLGFDRDISVEFAQMACVSGAAALFVHGRTREQFYSGTADWDAIRRVKEVSTVPVIGNGDVFSPEAAEQILKQTGCDSIMVARGALGNPFLFAQIRSYFATGQYVVPTERQRLDTALEQLEGMCMDKGERIAVPEAKKHIAWYLKGMRGNAEFKNRIFAASGLEQMRQILIELRDR